MFQKQFIFEDDREFASCHASTVLPLMNGDVLAAWFGGTEEGAGDVAIWLSRKQDGVWSKPVNLTGVQDLPHFNPVLSRNPNGQIILVYKTGWKIREWISMVMVSNDDGHTWSETKELVPGDYTGGRGPVKNKWIIASNGDLIAPASVETKTEWDAFVDLSSDGGKSWRKSEQVPFVRNEAVGKGIIQPALWESAPGKLHMLLRSTAERIYRSDSADGGNTWSEAYPINLPNNNSGIDLAQMENGDLLLVYNPVDGKWGARTPLVLDVSKDNGETWERIHVLEEDEGEYSYPAIVAIGDEVHITYTWKRERIAYWHLNYPASN